MRVALVSTYPPRPCGIATFATDLRRALLEADGSAEVVVAAMTGQGGQDPLPEVALTVRQQSRSDHVRAATALNDLGVDVVLLEHEFGIFGGDCGEHVVDLVASLEVPYVVTLHTVLSRPSSVQSRVLRELCHGAAEVTVFSTTARDLLEAAGLAPSGRVTVVNHGAPLELRRRAARVAPEPGAGLPELLPHAHRTVLSTFGLLSEGKGIESVIRALPEVVRRHPMALYVVAGRTHPEVARREGERYREGLLALVDELGLRDHVLFVDRFLSDGEVQQLLERTEVFLTPYRSQEQVVSGVLTFALAAGCPVVSTPYLYAADQLADGGGLLVPFDDPAATAVAVGRLLDDPGLRHALAEQAHAIGAQHTWPEVGRAVLKVLSRACERREPVGPSGGMAAGEPLERLHLGHLRTLVDHSGIVQHANELRPDPATGCCVDDVARLALVACHAIGRADGEADEDADGDAVADAVWLRTVLGRALDFLADAWDGDAGAMHNLRGVGGAWLDAPHHGDHLGRAVWALGEVAAAGPDEPTRCAAQGLLGEVLARPVPTSDLRPLAFGLLGVARLPERGTAVEALAEAWARQLAAAYRQHRTDRWRWFEDTLTYDNARLPQALLATSARTGDPLTRDIALESLDWYAAQCLLGSGTVSLVGNRWRTRPGGDEPSPALAAADEGDEQPLDAAALVEAFVEAHLLTGEPRHLVRAEQAEAWFHGANRLGTRVVDAVSGGCHDGLGAHGLNANEGAESTLAHLQAQLALGRVPGHRPTRPPA